MVVVYCFGEAVCYSSLTKNGKIVAKLTNPHQDRVEVAKSLFGILPKDADIEAARTIMGKLFSLTGILGVRADDCIDALASSINDYEDAVVEKVAHRNDMDYIVTRKIKDYQAGNTKIILPDDFVKFVEEE